MWILMLFWLINHQAISCTSLTIEPDLQTSLRVHLLDFVLECFVSFHKKLKTEEQEHINIHFSVKANTTNCSEAWQLHYGSTSPILTKWNAPGPIQCFLRDKVIRKNPSFQTPFPECVSPAAVHPSHCLLFTPFKSSVTIGPQPEPTQPIR